MGVYTDMFNRLCNMPERLCVLREITTAWDNCTETMDEESLDWYKEFFTDINGSSTFSAWMTDEYGLTFNATEKFLIGYLDHGYSIGVDDYCDRYMLSGEMRQHIMRNNRSWSVVNKQTPDSDNIELFNEYTNERKNITEKELYRMLKYGKINNLRVLSRLQEVKDYFRPVELLITRLCNRKPLSRWYLPEKNCNGKPNNDWYYQVTYSDSPVGIAVYGSVEEDRVQVTLGGGLVRKSGGFFFR